jgi:hypothetical protein
MAVVEGIKTASPPFVFAFSMLLVFFWNVFTSL